MTEQTDSEAAAFAAAIAALVVSARESSDPAAIARRGLGVLVDALRVRVALVAQVVEPVGGAPETGQRAAEPGRVVVREVAGRGDLAPGVEFDVGPRALRAGVSGFRPEAAEFCPEAADRIGDPAVGSGLCAVVTVEGRSWGLLGVCDTEGRVYGPGQVELLTAVAAVIGTAQERRLAESRRTELTALARFALGSRDVTATIDRTVEAVTRLADVPIGAAIRVEHFPSTLMVVHARGAPGLHLGLEYEVDPALGEALRGPEPVTIEDWRTDDRFRTPLLPPTASVIAALSVSLIVDGRPGGRLVAADRRPRGFSAAEVAAVRDAADLLAAVLARDRHERSDPRRSRPGTPTTAPLPRPTSPPVPGREGDTEVALVDTDGIIVRVNQAWLDFARDNGGDPARTGVGMSYLAICDEAQDPLAHEVGDAIRAAVRGDLPAPMMALIPCHAPERERWYHLLISSRFDDTGRCVGAAVTLSLARV